MGMELSVHRAKSVEVTKYDHFPETGALSFDFCRMEFVVTTEDGTRVTLTLYGSGLDGIAFSAPALEQRACAECGNLMPRDYHPRVTVCSACETEWRDPCDGPAPSPQELARLARNHMDEMGH